MHSWLNMTLPPRPGQVGGSWLIISHIQSPILPPPPPSLPPPPALPRSDWDPALVSEQVLAAKERWYTQLTCTGITAFKGATRLIQQAGQCGMLVGVASSGAPTKIQHNLQRCGAHSITYRGAGRTAAAEGVGSLRSSSG